MIIKQTALIGALTLAVSQAVYADSDRFFNEINGYGHTHHANVLDSTIPAHLDEDFSVDDAIYVFFKKAIRDRSAKRSLQLKRTDNDQIIDAVIDIRGATAIITPTHKLNYGTDYYLESTSPIKTEKGRKLKLDLRVDFKTAEMFIPVTEPTYSPADGEGIAPSGEIYAPVTPERAQLHAQHHNYYPAVTATLPSIFPLPVMDSADDFLITRDEMVSINPAPNEYLWIMEGRRHGFEDLTVVLTHTIPGNGAPLHTHLGEEAHVLLEGKMYYQLGEDTMVVEAPYIMNIPSMVPHGFINVGSEPAKLVGIFPDTNHWEYDVLDVDFFGDFFQSALAGELFGAPASGH